jgi:serine-type D-Ala-D-Ala carboxypeptidase (penicillin-binding protein 5/6)
VDLSTKRLVALITVVTVWLVAPPGEGPDTRLPAVVLAATQRPAEPEVGCAACLVVDDHGRTLWGRGAHETRSIASTTKMMTALVVRREATLEEEVTVSAAAAAVPEGKLSLQAGESFNVQELLYGLLLNSSNDAAVALAEHVSGSVEGFVALMNEEARRIGADESNFTTPHGLDALDHYSTASDLALIGEKLLEDEVLAEIVGTQEATISGSRRVVSLENTNLLLGSYPGALGIKTGFTASAGNVLVSAAERDGRRLIAVALGSADTFADSRAMLDYGFAVLRRGIVLRAGTPVGGVLFDTLGSSGIVAAKTLRGITDPSEVRLFFEPSEDLRAPIAAGTSVGTITIGDGDKDVGEVDAVTTSSIDDEEDQGWPAGVFETLLSGAASILPGEG